uniref:Uncharacterized protein n=1 Tax=Vespula pensylvanica TaxID=30213 RepID=A0A834P9P6_VESPE|nr:hypothetical protein H0235_002114 [Vespula pensylvanica]
MYPDGREDFPVILCGKSNFPRFSSRRVIPRKTTASRIQFSPGEARMKLGKSQQGDKNSDRPSDAINCNSVVPGGAFAIVLREIPGPRL